MASKPVTTGSSGLIIMSGRSHRFHCTEMRRAARCEPESTYVVWVPGTLSAPRRHPGACVGSSRSSRLASGHFDGGRCGRFACDGSAPVVRPRISGIVLSTTSVGVYGVRARRWSIGLSTGSCSARSSVMSFLSLGCSRRLWGGALMTTGSAGPYAARLIVDYPDRDLDKFSTLLRLFYLIPIAVVLVAIEGGGDNNGIRVRGWRGGYPVRPDTSHDPLPREVPPLVVRGIAKSCGWGRVVRRRPLIRGSSSQLGFRL